MCFRLYNSNENKIENLHGTQDVFKVRKEFCNISFPIIKETNKMIQVNE